MCRYPETPCGSPPHTDPLAPPALAPPALVAELLRTLCERDRCAARCLHQRPVLETLLEPLLRLLNGEQAPLGSLALVADVLAGMASTDGGLSLFLHQKNVLLRGERTAPVHVVVQFTLRLLEKDLPGLAGSDRAGSDRAGSDRAGSDRAGSDLHHPALCAAFLLVCRQFYQTSEGLQAVRPYGLQTAVANIWRQMSSSSEPLPTTVPGPSAAPPERLNLLVWKEALLDNLLNFAATPKGLLLLQQTGAIDECVSSMFSRFTGKLQVSRCETFGYGVMVTQVAATAPGVRALQASGFVGALVVELWSFLECGGDDVSVGQPKPTPMEPIDRSCLKSFLSLVNLLSSSQSVWELLRRLPLANRSHYPLRDVPASIPDLIDRLVVVNSEEKIRSLFHYEQSHTFGLRLLSVLCCSLDSFLLLETQYGVVSLLLQAQRDNIVDQDPDQGAVMVDGLSVERNHVLVRVGVVGGPSERTLPPRALQEGEHPYPWPMFFSYPPPGCYTPAPPEAPPGSADPDVLAYLALPQESRGGACRELFCRAVTSGTLTGEVLADLLEEAVVRLSGSSTGCFFPAARFTADEQTVKSAALLPVDQLGILTCLRYGRNLKLLREDAIHKLPLLVKRVKIFLSSQRLKTSSQFVTLQDYPGHDWLTSTVFLIMAGDLERSFSLLLHLSNLLASAFIWPARVHASVHFPKGVAESGVPPLYWCSAHYVELLLKTEAPLVHAAFRMSGFTPAQMCLHWSTQCFWNYLDWTEIRLYLGFCLLLGPDYQVYTSVAVLKHLQPHILQRAQSQELQVFLKEEPIHGFRLGDYLDFMVGLEHRYRGLVLTDMRTVLDPVH